MTTVEHAVGTGEPSAAPVRRRRLTAAGAAAVLAAAFVLTYGHILAGLWHDWATDENYSHGFLIVPVAAYLAWRKRDALRAAVRQPRTMGLVIIVLSLALYVGGALGAELFVSRVSLLGLLAGSIVFLLGWRHLRILAFPVGLLLLMIPLPAIIFNQITFPLQLLASWCGQAALTALRIPVLREGNVITLATTSLYVAQACSGIRSLISLLTLAVLYGYFTDPRLGVRAALVMAAVPTAVLANGARIAGTGIAASYVGAEAAEGVLHTFSGWVVFVVALLLLLVIKRLIVLAVGAPAVAPANGNRSAVASAAGTKP